MGYRKKVMVALFVVCVVCVAGASRREFVSDAEG